MLDEKQQIIPQQELAATTESLNAIDAIAAKPLEQLEAPKEQPKPEGGHFRRLREEKEKAERERDEMLKLLSQVNNQKSQSPQEEEVRYNPDDLVEWKVVDKKLKQYEKRLQEYEQRTSEQMIETRIKSQYQDFEKVASEENIAILRNEYPEIANTLASATDRYSQAASVYTLIKKLGIYKEDLFAPDRERARQNAAKPKPASLIAPSVGSAALGEAASYDNKITPELQKKLYAEMRSKSKGGYF